MESVSTNIDCSVGVHSCCGCREEHGLLPLTTEVINPPGVLVRTVRHWIIRHHFMNNLSNNKRFLTHFCHTRIRDILFADRTTSFYCNCAGGRCASTNFSKKKLFMKYGLVTWISEFLTSNGRSKCRSLRTITILPPRRLWSWSIVIHIVDLLTDRPLW